MIIVGLDSRQRATPAGEFHCPVCQRRRTFARLEQVRRLTLFFVPVLPLGSQRSGRLACTTCHSEFAEHQVT